MNTAPGPRQRSLTISTLLCASGRGTPARRVRRSPRNHAARPREKRRAVPAGGGGECAFHLRMQIASATTKQTLPVREPFMLRESFPILFALACEDDHLTNVGRRALRFTVHASGSACHVLVSAVRSSKSARSERRGQRENRSRDQEPRPRSRGDRRKTRGKNQKKVGDVEKVFEK